MHHEKHRSKRKATAQSIRCVDLFCGAGGLTHGLEATGIDVALGIDIDPACEYPYSANNKADFLLKPVEEIIASDVSCFFKGAPFKLLAGCAPCQPFSSYSQGWSNPSDKRWHLLDQFSRLVRETQPHLVTMENVPPLKYQGVFTKFKSTLINEGFKVFYSVINCADYQVPQLRRRLVVLASKLGSIDMIAPTTPDHRRLTVEHAIGHMPPLATGQACIHDPLHISCDLSPLNLKRIRASKPGGTWQDWDRGLIAKCHARKSGKTYRSVYGRMTWDDPSPTITTQYYGYGNGRFGHPEQDRAISLREGAILQSFTKNYKFVPEGAPISKKSVGQLVGNAVPVKLSEAIGMSIVRHVDSLA